MVITQHYIFSVYRLLDYDRKQWGKQVWILASASTREIAKRTKDSQTFGVGLANNVIQQAAVQRGVFREKFRKPRESRKICLCFWLVSTKKKKEIKGKLLFCVRIQKSSKLSSVARSKLYKQLPRLHFLKDPKDSPRRFLGLLNTSFKIRYTKSTHKHVASLYHNEFDGKRKSGQYSSPQ